MLFLQKYLIFYYPMKKHQVQTLKFHQVIPSHASFRYTIYALAHYRYLLQKHLFSQGPMIQLQEIRRKIPTKGDPIMPSPIKPSVLSALSVPLAKTSNLPVPHEETPGPDAKFHQVIPNHANFRKPFML